MWSIYKSSNVFFSQPQFIPKEFLSMVYTLWLLKTIFTKIYFTKIWNSEGLKSMYRGRFGLISLIWPSSICVGKVDLVIRIGNIVLYWFLFLEIIYEVYSLHLFAGNLVAMEPYTRSQRAFCVLWKQ